MDPNANIEAQRQLARAIREWNDGEMESGYDRVVVWAAELAELVIALDEWRRKGGFDPYTDRSCLDGAPLHHVRTLLDYNWPDEERDYAEHGHNGDSQAGHVFESMRIIDSWLNEITED